MHTNSGLSNKEWRMLRNAILNRDDQTCFRCDKKFRAKGMLSVHHIVPRAEGGSNDATNLITLCHPCHDHVEINELDTKAKIMGSYDIPGVEIKKQISNDEGVREESFPRPDWHKYVYGGKSR